MNVNNACAAVGGVQVEIWQCDAGGNYIHVDVYRSGAIVKSTQIAFPEDVTRSVYSSGVYASKGQNSTSNAGDMVFADSLADELATITGGNTSSGYTATFRVGISV